MKEVSADDVIFHSYQGNIVAISVSKGNCCSFARPGASFSEWDKDGRRIDTEYFVLSKPFLVAPHIPRLYSIQSENGPYTSTCRGKQQYLCEVSLDMFVYIMEHIYKSLSLAEGERLASFLGAVRTLERIAVTKQAEVKPSVTAEEKKSVEIQQV